MKHERFRQSLRQVYEDRKRKKRRKKEEEGSKEEDRQGVDVKQC